MRGPDPRGVTPGTLTLWVYAIWIASSVEAVVVDLNRAWARGPPSCRWSTDLHRRRAPPLEVREVRAATRRCGRRRGARHECHLWPSWRSCRALFGVGCRDSRVSARGWGMRIPLPRGSRGRNHSCATMLRLTSGSHILIGERRSMSHRKNLFVLSRLKMREMGSLCVSTQQLNRLR